MSKVSANTVEDIGFAIMYLEYVSRRAQDPARRQRAKILLALVARLDDVSPGWRERFILRLQKSGEVREIGDLLRLPDGAEARLLQDFSQSLGDDLV